MYSISAHKRGKRKCSFLFVFDWIRAVTLRLGIAVVYSSNCKEVQRPMLYCFSAIYLSPRTPSIFSQLYSRTDAEEGDYSTIHPFDSHPSELSRFEIRDDPGDNQVFGTMRSAKFLERATGNFGLHWMMYQSLAEWAVKPESVCVMAGLSHA